MRVKTPCNHKRRNTMKKETIKIIALKTGVIGGIIAVL